MLNKVRKMKVVRARSAATGEKVLLAGVPEEDRDHCKQGRPDRF